MTERIPAMSTDPGSAPATAESATTESVAAQSVAARPAIVVGYDGSPCSDDALRWAVDQAIGRGLPLRLASALDNRYMSAGHDLPFYPEVRDEWRSLRAVRDAVLDDHPDLEVGVDVRLGMITKLLVEQTDGHAMLVLGKRGLGAFGRIALGSVSVAVAGRCPVPVVIVPPAWKTAEHSGQQVVIGLHPFEPNSATLAFGFAEAARTKSRVVIVDARDNPPILVWDILAAEPSYLVTARRDHIDDELTPYGDEYPGVPVRIAHDSGHPVDVLLKESEGAQLVVVGRHHSGLTGFGIGSVARGVLHHAEVPVAVVPST